MSLLDDVSLMITPNGVKSNVLFGVLPTPTIGNELITNGDFATDSDWTKGTGWTISGGKANCDGSQSAQSNFYQVGIVPINIYYQVTFTATVVSGGVTLAIGGSNAQPITTASGTYTVYSKATSGDSNLYFSANSTFVGSIDNVSVKEYTSADMDFTRATTATIVNSAGLVASVATGFPRLDYTGGGCPHILAEPQRTNLVVNSITGTYGNAPGSSTQVTAPDNTNTAVKPVPNNVDDRYEETIAGGTYATNTKLTYSWYRKRISTPIDTGFVGDLDVKNIVNGSISSVATQIESDVNGFDRFSVTFNITDGSLESKFRLYFGNVIGVGNSSVAYWGHQLEEGIYNTSLIPTSGSTVTRNAETFTRTGIADLINSAEGVFYVEIASISNNLSSREISLSDGTLTNRIEIRYLDVSNTIQAVIRNSSGSLVSLSYAVTDILDFHKVAFKYKSGDFALWVDGTERDTNTTAFVTTGLNRLAFDSGQGAGSFFYGKVRNLQIYKTALSDTQLDDLTS